MRSAERGWLQRVASACNLPDAPLLTGVLWSSVGTLSSDSWQGPRIPLTVPTPRNSAHLATCYRIESDWATSDAKWARCQCGVSGDCGVLSESLEARAFPHTLPYPASRFTPSTTRRQVVTRLLMVNRRQGGRDGARVPLPLEPPSHGNLFEGKDQKDSEAMDG